MGAGGSYHQQRRGDDETAAPPMRVPVAELARWLGLEPSVIEATAASRRPPVRRQGDENVIDLRDLTDGVPPDPDPVPANLRALLDLSLQVAAGASPESLCRAAVGPIGKALRARSAAVFLESDYGRLDQTAATVPEEADGPKGMAAWVAAHGEPLLLPDPRRACTQGAPPDDPRDALAVPLRLDGRPVGVLVATGPRDSLPFTNADLALATVAATQLAQAVERARLLTAHPYRRQLEAYARDLRETYAAEKARAEQLAEALAELQRTYLATVRGFAVSVEAKDEYTGGHIVRVTRYGLMMMRRLSPQHALDLQYEYGFLLHDIGKLAVPDAVLTKNGPLTDEEWELMRRHPETGRRILAGIPFLAEAKEIVYAHHERWDGKGYPRGLAGDEIPLGARVFPVADSFDAMTSDRPYRAAMPPAEAMAELLRGSGTQFWPAAVEAFHSFPPDEIEAARTRPHEWDPSDRGRD